MVNNTIPLGAYNNIVDGNVNQFDKKSNKAHNAETYGSGYSNFLKFCSKTLV